MADELVTVTAADLPELVLEPGVNDIVVIHQANISARMSWTNLKAWILKAGSIVGSMIEDGAISLNKLAVNSVNQSKIVNASVTNDKIAQDAVREVHILDANVTGAKLASGAVTHDKLAADSVRNAKIENGAVNTDKLANLAVTGAKIANGTISADKLNSGVLHDMARIVTLSPADARGEKSGQTPPEYANDEHYIHEYPDLLTANPIIMLGNAIGSYLAIENIEISGGLGGSGGDSRALTVVVSGKLNEEPIYQLVIMELI